MRIVEAWCEGGDLLVAFEDGARVRVGIERLVPSGKRGLDWGSLRVDPYELVVPAADGDHEISWLAIRRLTDPAFEAHLERSARASARRIGRKLRALREQHGSSDAEVAARSALPVDRLRRIEAGEDGIDLVALEAILRSLGRSWDDLAEPAGEASAA